MVTTSFVYACFCAYILIGGIEPKSDFAKLTNKTEVIVAPKTRRPAPVAEDNLNTSSTIKTQPSMKFRVAPSLEEEVDDLSVYIHPDSLELFDKIPIRVRLTRLVPIFLSNRREEEQQQQQQQQEAEDGPKASALFATLVVSTNVPSKHAWIGSVLRKTLEMKDFDIIK